MHHRYDAVIIGGGVAGASCAILLAQAGWSVALVEKQRFPRRKVCGECIAAPNLVLLDALGIGSEFRALAGPPLRRIGWYTGESMIEAPMPPFRHGPYEWGCALGREQLDTLLLQRARELGVDVLQPWTVRRIEPMDGLQCCPALGPGGATAQLQAPMLIAAHGSWQPPPAMGAIPDSSPQARKLPSDLFAFKANFSNASLPDGLLPVLAFAGGYGGMVQADGGLLTLACCIRRDRLHRCRADHTASSAGEAVQALLEGEIGAVRRTLAGAHREGAWLSVGPIRPRIGSALIAEGVFAVGNAAGEAHPILGEGISMALQSAFLLCQGLIAGGPRMAPDYARSWRHSFAPRIRLAALYAHAAMHPRAAPALVALLQHRPSLLGVAARLGGKLRCAVEPAAPANSKAH